MSVQPAELTLRIEKLVYGGDGLARADGRVVLTPFVLPEESVRVQLQRAKSDLLRGKLLNVLEPATVRREAPCPYFQSCGGCHYQHATDAYQLEQKQAILREVLRRVGHFEFEGEIATIAAEPWHYRNRTQLHVEKGRLGYFAAGSHDVVAVDHCPISSPKLNEAIGKLSLELPHYRSFTATVELFTNETDLQVHILDRIPPSVRPLFDGLGSNAPIQYGAFRVSHGSFFQVNRFLVDQLVAEALGDASGGAALDLYAGVGLFSHALAGRFRSVAAVESSFTAFRDLEWNSQQAGLAITNVRKTAEDYLASLETPPDLILADPPRSGLGKLAIRELLRLRAPQITIVSCDPATLARDVAVLIGGGYKIARLSLADLFPQTFHLETVAQLWL